MFGCVRKFLMRQGTLPLGWMWWIGHAIAVRFRLVRPFCHGPLLSRGTKTPEHFPPNWLPVRHGKCGKYNKLKPTSDSKKLKRALVLSCSKHLRLRKLATPQGTSK
jgi:hypothetical protein